MRYCSIDVKKIDLVFFEVVERDLFFQYTVKCYSDDFGWVYNTK